MKAQRTAYLLKFILIFACLINFSESFSQTINQVNLSPNGLFENVYDHYGNKYSLNEILINNSSNVSSRYVDNTCNSGIFVLHFTNGSGMENATDPIHIARRNVICQVFNDLSNFINTPLKNAGNTQKVNIWVRNIVDLAPISNGLLGVASSFNVLPIIPTATTVTGGITDNEVWKTIHTGVDSYTGVISPLTVSSSATTTSGLFYHGFVAFNFADPLINWNLNTSINCPTNLYDLYSVALHEVTHALGFASLIGANGNSRLNNGNYYSRYDTFLRTTTNQLLISNNGCNTMYNNFFIANQNQLNPGCVPGSSTPDNTNCTDAIKYSNGSMNVPLYTSQCFEEVSSLSHFEDQCYNNPTTSLPYGNNNYFTMSNANGNGATKRFLKTEERNAICDIGYSVTNTFGSTSNLSYFNYGGTGSCTGIRVAGVNDGIIASGPNLGQFSFVGVGTTISPIILPINSAGGILTNDVNFSTNFATNSMQDLRIECLQDVYDATALINGSNLPFTSTASINSINFTSTISGLHLLRYVPVANGIRGNITYVFVYVNTFNCVATTCNMVSNGNFESAINGGPFNNNTLSCWGNLAGSADLFSRFSTALDFVTNINTIGSNPPVDSHNGLANNNHNFIGLWSSTPSSSEATVTKLNTPLIAGQNYVLSFWARVCNNFTNTPNINTNQELAFYSIQEIPVFNGIYMSLNDATLSTVGFTNGVNPNVFFPRKLFANVTVLANLTWQYFSIPFVIPAGTSNHNALAILKGSFSTVNSPHTYLFIDDVSILPASQVPTFNVPPICTNQVITLSNFLTPAPANGTFTIGTSSNAITTFTSPVAGNFLINYNYTNNVGCPATIATTITVNPRTTPTFNSIPALCKGASTFTLPTTSLNGITGSWSPAPNNQATTTYTFTPNQIICANNATMTVNVNVTPTITTITPITQTVCRNLTPINLQVNATGTGLTYQWYSNITNTNSGGTLIAGATFSSYTPLTNNLGTKYYYVIINNGSCSSISPVLTVKISKGTSDPGILSGTQTVCRREYTTFVSNVSGGTWTSSNPSIANITNTTSNVATILGANVGTATITYTMSNGTCSNSITRTVTVLNYVTPNFEMTLEGGTNQILCQGDTPPTLPTISDNGISGTWSPFVVNNTTSGNYLFTPNLGQCATPINYSFNVIPTNAFVANDDFISVTFPTTTITTNNPITTNDTYNGSGLNNLLLPAGIGYSISLVGTLPTFPVGGATLNSQGNFVIQPNTSPGVYLFNYVINGTCGASNIATITLTINAFVYHPGKIEFGLCFNPNGNQYNSNDVGPSPFTSLFDMATVNGQPANASNATITMLTSGAPIIVNPNGTFTFTSSLPGFYSFNYRICANANGQCSGDIVLAIYIFEPLIAQNDVFYYFNNTSPPLFNVIENDWILECPTIVGVSTSTVTITQITPNPYFSINSSGQIITNTSTPPGSYNLNYQICSIANPSICRTATVWIDVINANRISNLQNLNAINLDNMIITPNPSGGVFELIFDTILNNRIEFEVFDVLGKKINFGFIEMENTSYVIDLRNYSKGVYLLKIKYGNQVIIKKLIKD